MHEAGHAVAAWMLGIRVHRVSIKPDTESEGRCTHSNLLRGIQLEFDNSTRARVRAEREIKISLAGHLAQRKYNPRAYRHYHSQVDYEDAIQILSYITGSNEELNAYLRLLRIQTRQMLEAPHVWRCVQRIAEALLKRRELSEVEIKAILKKTYTSGRVRPTQKPLQMDAGK